MHFFFGSVQMDSFNINIKVEKAKAMKKDRQLQRIASLFRFVEICIILSIVSRFSVQIPVAMKNFGVYFKDLSVVLASPHFVFIVGNVIVITLFAKSGHFSGKKTNLTSDIYEEFIEKSKRVQGVNRYESENGEKHSISVLQKADDRGKQSISVPNRPEETEKWVKSFRDLLENREKQSISVEKEVKKDETLTCLTIKHIERSQSEKLEQNQKRELRRTGTEKVGGSEGWFKIAYPEDRMSNEEFRCTIESFIERQKRFRRDEENNNSNYCMLD